MRARLLTALFLLFSVGLLSPSTAYAQAAAVLKAQQAQAESQKQAIAKKQSKEKRAALDAAGLKPSDVNDLITTLEDPEARNRLVTRLKVLGAAENTANTLAQKPPSRFGGRIVETLSAKIDGVSQQLVSGAEFLLDAPRIVDWAQRQATVPENRDLWLRVLWKVLAVLFAGFIAEWVIRRLLARTRLAIEGQERDSLLVRLPFLLARTVVDVLPIAAFAAIAYLVMPLLEPTEVTRLVTISLVNASVIARAVMAVARMFFVPRATNLRIVKIGDETANYIVLWIRRITNIAVYGYFLAEAALLLGLPQGGYVALTKIIGLLLALLLVILVLQNRVSAATAIRGSVDGGMSGMRMLRRRVGDIWHVLAIIYIAAVYLVWALDVNGGFEFVFRATALSIVIIFAAKLLVIGSRGAVDKGFGVRQEVIQKFPGLAARANRYFAIVHLVISAAITVIAIFAVLEAWGVDSFGWVGTDMGRRVVGSIVSSTFVIVIAVIFWELVSSAIERYLARGADGGVELSARAKTLLPLLRKALLIVVTTIVSLIVLSEIGVNIGPLLAGAGVIGLAIGFGSQTLVKDVITGVFILAEDQFAVGDVVRVNDKAGLVEEITIRTIRLRDVGGNVHMIPFSSVGMVENMTKDFSRYVFDVGIAYREDIDEVIEVLRALGAEMQEDDYYGPLINQPIEIMGLQKFDDSAVVVRARLTTKPIKQWEIGREFNRRMKRKFDELGIEIPFPHQTIYFGEDKSGNAPPAPVEVIDRRTPKDKPAGEDKPTPKDKPAADNKPTRTDVIEQGTEGDSGGDI
jgi:moderate conductance mechanosensitive channel